MKVRLAGIIPNSLNNGEGIRKVIFAQGCKHKCKGCFNPETHDFNGGELFNVDDIIKEINDDYMIDGVTFSGGDPVEQAESFAYIAKNINNDLTVWCYTGYTFEYLLEWSKTDNNIKDLLENIDVLVDGRFEIDKLSNQCKFRGSTNQRLVDAVESLKQGKYVEYNL